LISDCVCARATAARAEARLATDDRDRSPGFARRNVAISSGNRPVAKVRVPASSSNFAVKGMRRIIAQSLCYSTVRAHKIRVGSQHEEIEIVITDRAGSAPTGELSARDDFVDPGRDRRSAIGRPQLDGLVRIWAMGRASARVRTSWLYLSQVADLFGLAVVAANRQILRRCGSWYIAGEKRADAFVVLAEPAVCAGGYGGRKHALAYAR
jgi:hypothetical protein